mmetsp:Transcript_10778/g.28837  ORF Transcript_10778/g.28837 Transcript_10778/m.28837 type:complete len:315 (-) Transcript_10778:753-1697(-)
MEEGYGESFWTKLEGAKSMHAVVPSPEMLDPLLERESDLFEVPSFEDDDQLVPLMDAHGELYSDAHSDTSPSLAHPALMINLETQFPSHKTVLPRHLRSSPQHQCLEVAADASAVPSFVTHAHAAALPAPRKEPRLILPATATPFPTAVTVSAPMPGTATAAPGATSSAAARTRRRASSSSSKAAHNYGVARSAMKQSSRGERLGAIVSGEPIDAEALGDLTGTTAMEARKMSESERQVVLLKRKMRNRESARRSRVKKQATLRDMNEEYFELLDRAHAMKHSVDMLETQVARVRSQSSAMRRKIDGQESALGK